MESQKVETLDKTLLVADYLTIRKAVGIIGIILPFILIIGTFLFSKCNRIENSISDYYYTIMGHYMVGTLCAVALFLYSYKGYDKTDNLLSNLSCIFALGVSFCPTACFDNNPYCNIMTVNSSNLVSSIHNIFAALFLLSLAYYSYFIFTKGPSSPTLQKIKRNIIFKICGIIMFISVILIALIVNIPWLAATLCPYKIIFILETVALWAFGFSWIVKGQMIIKDVVPPK